MPHISASLSACPSLLSVLIPTALGMMTRKSTRGSSFKHFLLRRSSRRKKACTCFGQNLSTHLTEIQCTIPPLIVLCAE
eukprot:Ihof_evm3s228 gene=Ihof_evmTU3s228